MHAVTLRTQVRNHSITPRCAIGYGPWLQDEFPGRFWRASLALRGRHHLPFELDLARQRNSDTATVQHHKQASRCCAALERGADHHTGTVPSPNSNSETSCATRYQPCCPGCSATWPTHTHEHSQEDKTSARGRAASAARTFFFLSVAAFGKLLSCQH